MTIDDWYALLPLGLTALLGVASTVAECVGGRWRAQTMPIATDVTDSRTGSLARVDLPRGDVRVGGPLKVVAGAGCVSPPASASATCQGHPS